MDLIERSIIERIDHNRDSIIAFAWDIYSHAELGYKEHRTASKFAEALKKVGISTVNESLAITGVKGYLKSPTDSHGITLSIIGELDALRIPTHPFANPETQAAHCCGHHAQLAGVIGAAFALSDPTISGALGGNVVFFAVPAEEYGEIEYKNELRDSGKIKYGGGKSELIRIGAFDDINLSIVHHTGVKGICIGNGTSNGFVSKMMRYQGRSAHAAGAPHLGVNALYAATLGLSALQHLRETFRDQDCVRVHPILTQGGDLVNVIPEEATIETLVRAKNTDAILDADRKTDRALKAGADAMGAGYKIVTLPGYLPRLAQQAHPSMLTAAKLAAPDREINEIEPGFHGAGSTDVGDLQHIQPVLSFSTGGVSGAGHSAQYTIVDEEEAYITTAKIFALTAYELLKENAKAAKQISEEYKAPFTKEQYLDFMDNVIRVEERGLLDHE